MSASLELICSSQFLSWLNFNQLSLALITYQTNRLFLVGFKLDGRLSTFERLYERAMGLYVQADQLYLSTRYQLWQLWTYTLGFGVAEANWDTNNDVALNSSMLVLDNVEATPVPWEAEHSGLSIVGIGLLVGYRRFRRWRQRG